MNKEDKPTSSFLDSIMRFIKTQDEKGSVLYQARNSSEARKAEIDKQLKTFADDLKSGKLSYAEMRSRYG